MSSLKQIGLCAMAAACFGCQVSMDVATNEQAWASMTPGGQTPIPKDPITGRLGYYEYLPAGYETGTKFPLIVSFSAHTGSGTPPDLERVLQSGVPKLIEDGKEFPAIVISPQTSTNWSPSISTPFVDYILSHYDVDPDRIYITG
jgi:predicted peptidase